jgi:hypothetical protein
MNIQKSMIYPAGTRRPETTTKITTIVIILRLKFIFWFVLWITVLWTLVVVYHSLGEAYCLYLQISTVKIETVCFFEALVPTFHTARFHNQEDHKVKQYLFLLILINLLLLFCFFSLVMLNLWLTLNWIIIIIIIITIIIIILWLLSLFYICP